MNTFRLLLISCVFLFLYSCKTLQVSSLKNNSNTKDIGLEWNYGEKVNDKLRVKIDAAMSEEIKNFNSQGHSFVLHVKKPKDKDYISVGISRGKIVRSGGKAAGYIISGIGLVAVPVALIALETGVFGGFYSLPNHRIDSRFALSSTLSGDRYHDKQLITETGALFSGTEKKVNKLVVKFISRFHTSLVKIETQLGEH